MVSRVVLDALWLAEAEQRRAQTRRGGPAGQRSDLKDALSTGSIGPGSVAGGEFTYGTLARPARSAASVPTGCAWSMALKTVRCPGTGPDGR